MRTLHDISQSVVPKSSLASKNHLIFNVEIATSARMMVMIQSDICLIRTRFWVNGI